MRSPNRAAPAGLSQLKTVLPVVVTVPVGARCAGAAGTSAHPLEEDPEDTEEDAPEDELLDEEETTDW